jgi:enoyl-CoA hydratase/carnithine racemase
MAGDLVPFHKKDHIGYIRLNRPETGNRMDPAMAQELIEACITVNGDQDIYLAVITGAGEAFCAGGDTRQLVLSGEAEGLPSRQGPAEALAQLNCPIVASINGEAVGEGLELALACDLRIASGKAWFGLPQVTEGWIPLDGGTQRLSRIVGKGKALEMVLTGEIINAKTALEIGLVNKVVSPESLESEVEVLARSLAGKAPLSLRYAKEAVQKGLDLTLEQGLRLEADLYFLLHTTADRTEGIQSYLQKRKPDYKGR